MALKTKKQIQQDLITDFLNEQDKITYMGKAGAAKAILNAVANVDFELWNDVFQTKRSLIISTAAGSDLDALAERRGITRLGASKNSVVLIFNGPNGTVIPAGTIIQSNINSAVKYSTQQEITLGDNNPSLIRPLNAESIGDIVLAESTETGTAYSVNANELTEFEVEIEGVTATNLTPSTGGADAESDEDFRERIIQQIDLLAQGTQAFYEALAKSVESSVKDAYATRNGNSGVKVYLIKNSLAVYSSAELTAIANSMYSEQRSFQPIACVNAEKLSIEITGEFFLRTGFSADTVFSNVASVIATYIDEIFDFGTTIKYNEIFRRILDTEGISGINSNRFYLNGGTIDVICTATQIPAFTNLQFETGDGTIDQSITQSYLITE